MNGILFGYGMRIAQLDADTIAEYKLDLGRHDPADCVAVFGSDMAECLACVVDIRDGANEYPVLVWADRSDAEGVPLFADHGEFAEALHDVLVAVMPHLRRGGGE